MHKLLLAGLLGLMLASTAQAQYGYNCPPRQPYQYNYWWYRSPSGYTFGSFTARTLPTPYQPIPHAQSSWHLEW